MGEFLHVYFYHTGFGWAAIGAIIVVMLGGLGSSRGIKIASMQAAGVLSEKPDLFGRLLILIALPGTQGFYGFICAIMISLRSGIIKGEVSITPVVGMSILIVAVCTGYVLWRSAIYQGETSAAAINLTSKQPEESGRAILMPALVETYAVIALLASILLIIWFTKEGGLSYMPPNVTVQ